MLKFYDPKKLKDNGSPVLLIDFSWIMYNSFFASREDNKEAAKTVVQRIYRLREMYPNSLIVIVMDSSESFRKNLYPDYKGNRKHPDGVFEHQKKILQALSLCKNILIAQKNPWESDDIVFTLWELYKDFSGGVLIHSEDQDFLPFISSSTTMFSKVNQNKIIPRDRVQAEQKLNYDLNYMTEIKIICGDPHNNITGIPKFRKSIATEIITCGKKMDIDYKEFFLSEKTLEKLPLRLQKSIRNAKEKYSNNVREIKLRAQIIPLQKIPDLQLLHVPGKRDAFDWIFT